jgi:hypothetical protein
MSSLIVLASRRTIVDMVCRYTCAGSYPPLMILIAIPTPEPPRYDFLLAFRFSLRSKSSKIERRSSIVQDPRFSMRIWHPIKNQQVRTFAGYSDERADRKVGQMRAATHRDPAILCREATRSTEWQHFSVWRVYESSAIAPRCNISKSCRLQQWTDFGLACCHRF